MAKTNLLKKIAVGAAIAGAAGYVAGVLSAPGEGKKTRKRLKKSAESSVTEVEKQIKELHTELGELMDQVKRDGGKSSDKVQKKLHGVVDNARGTKDKLREILTSIQDGKVTDKDLKRALEDARRTLDHLKEFIKK